MDANLPAHAQRNRIAWDRWACQRRETFGVPFPLHVGNAEESPAADARFGFAISEYGGFPWRAP